MQRQTASPGFPISFHILCHRGCVVPLTLLCGPWIVDIQTELCLDDRLSERDTGDDEGLPSGAGRVRYLCTGAAGGTELQPRSELEV